MYPWMSEELAWRTHAERQRKLEADRLLVDFSALAVRLTFTSRVALKLSDWLIASGERLRRRHEKTASVSAWADIRKFAR
jgi:hypothetical protein